MDDAMWTYYVDGVFVPAARASLPVGDLAVQRGYGVFDFMRTYGGQIFRFRAHIARLMRSAALAALPLPWPAETIAQIVSETLAHNRHLHGGEFAVKALITGGSGGGFDAPVQPRLLVTVDPMYGYPPEYHTHGITAVTAPDMRYLPEAKTINYTSALLAYWRARAQGAHDALYVDGEGHVLEATRANLFAFLGDTLVTPDTGILPGVTRAVALELAEGHFPVQVRAVALDELHTAGEAFVTSSSKEIMPLVRVDGAALGDGRPGARTRMMARLFREHAGRCAEDVA